MDVPDDRVVLGRRFCGPPDSGNGGYVCGVLAAYVGEPAQVTLRRPPPLGIPLTVTREAGSARLEHDGALVAEAVPAAAGGPAVEDRPRPVGLADAREASAGSWLRTSPERHPFPSCFVCGPDRADGLGIAPGRVAGQDVSADVWSPSADLAGSDGFVRPEFLWAALDCTSGIGAFDDDPDGPPYLLGRLAVRQVAPVQAGEPHVVTGWRLSREGRKMLAGSALFTAGGDLAALGVATWIQLS